MSQSFVCENPKEFQHIIRVQNTNIIGNPEKYSIPEWFFNRRRDYRDGVDMHASTNVLETKIREDLERMKKSRRHRGLRHHWLLKVRGQHTNSTGRRGVMIGVVRKQQRDK